MNQQFEEIYYLSEMYRVGMVNEAQFKKLLEEVLCKKG